MKLYSLENHRTEWGPFQQVMLEYWRLRIINYSAANQDCYRSQFISSSRAIIVWKCVSYFSKFLHYKNDVFIQGFLHPKAIKLAASIGLSYSVSSSKFSSCNISSHGPVARSGKSSGEIWWSNWCNDKPLEEFLTHGWCIIYQIYGWFPVFFCNQKRPLKGWMIAKKKGV